VVAHSEPRAYLRQLSNEYVPPPFLPLSFSFILFFILGIYSGRSSLSHKRICNSLWLWNFWSTTHLTILFTTKRSSIQPSLSIRLLGHIRTSSISRMAGRFATSGHTQSFDHMAILRQVFASSASVWSHGKLCHRDQNHPKRRGSMVASPKATPHHSHHPSFSAAVIAKTKKCTCMNSAWMRNGSRAIGTTTLRGAIGCILGWRSKFKFYRWNIYIWNLFGSVYQILK